MIIGIVGSRRRNSKEDYLNLGWKIVELEDENNSIVKKIVTGDCDEGGDKFARKIANDTDDIELEVKHKLDPIGNRWINAEKSGWVTYWEFTRMCYSRNEEIAKEDMDFLIALVHHSRKGGTENTIKQFKKYHKEWENKLIIL